MASKNTNLILTVKEPEGPEPIPVGVYKAKVDSVEHGSGQYGDYAKFLFEVIDGPQKGAKRSAIASMKLTKGGKPSKLFQYVSVLLGKEPNTNTQINLTELVGKKCQILVDDKPGDEDGWQTVSKVMPAA